MQAARWEIDSLRQQLMAGAGGHPRAGGGGSPQPDGPEAPDLPRQEDAVLEEEEEGEEEDEDEDDDEEEEDAADVDVEVTSRTRKQVLKKLGEIGRCSMGYAWDTSSAQPPSPLSAGLPTQSTVLVGCADTKPPLEPEVHRADPESGSDLRLL
jgi:hypothetical protein